MAEHRNRLFPFFLCLNMSRLIRKYSPEIKSIKYSFLWRDNVRKMKKKKKSERVGEWSRIEKIGAKRANEGERKEREREREREKGKRERTRIEN